MEKLLQNWNTLSLSMCFLILCIHQISEDSLSWKDSQPYWERKAEKRKAELECRLAAIPEPTTDRCYIMELSTEIRQQIMEYILDWKDVECMQAREDPKDRESKVLQVPKDWKKIPLGKLPFHFSICPPLFRMNRQILCEAISVLMREPISLSQPFRSGCPGSHTTECAISSINNTVLFPTAMLLKLYYMATSEKLCMIPKMMVLIPLGMAALIPVLVEADFLWSHAYDQLFQLWKSGLEFDFLDITVRKTVDVPSISSKEKEGQIVSHERTIQMEGFTWIR
jgi:hypothetical protein